jgi:hypothetical protein
MGWALLNSSVRGRTTHTSDGVEDTLPQNFSSQSFWRWVGSQADGGWNIFSGGDNHLARRWASAQQIRWTTQGMPSFGTLTPEHKESIRIAITVKQKSPLLHTGTATEEKRLGSQFSLGSSERVQTLHAESAATTYFAPPEAVDRLMTVPNLFQPFWQARLIDVAKTKRDSLNDKSTSSRSAQSTTP